MAKKWIAYGATGVVGIAVFGVGAIAAAQALDLRTSDGQVVEGVVVGERIAVSGNDTESGRAVLSTPTPGEAPSLETPNSIPGPSPFSVVTPGEGTSDSTPDGAPTRLPAPEAESAASAAEDT